MRKFTLISILIVVFSWGQSFCQEGFAQEVIDKAIKASVATETISFATAYGQPHSSQGSGFVIDSKKGLVVTNEHVVKGASISEYFVTFHNGQRLPAKLKYYDLYQDFAILQIQDTSLIPEDVVGLELADYEPTLNQGVLIVSNSEGQSFSVHSGYVSALYEVTGFMPQRSYRINTNAKPGASGSSVIDAKGKVLALTYGGGESYAFVLKIQYVIDALEQLNRGQIPLRKASGLILDTYSLDMAVRHRNFPQDVTTEYLKTFPNARNNVLVVQSSLAGTGADNYFRPGDIIWAVNGEQIGADLYKFDQLLNNSKGNTARITIYRNGKKQEVVASLYDLQANKINKLVEFAGGWFCEANDVMSFISGAPIKSVCLTRARNGSTMAGPGLSKYNADGIYRMVIKAVDNVKINSLHGLVEQACRMARENKTFSAIDVQHYISYAPNFGQYWITDHSNGSIDLLFTPTDMKPKVYEYDAAKMEWKLAEDACAAPKK